MQTSEKSRRRDQVQHKTGKLDVAIKVQHKTGNLDVAIKVQHKTGKLDVAIDSTGLKV